jgi:trehalose/maltose hydrolase-like predicted phosphorylase
MMENLWKSDIVIEGDLGSQLDIRLALYHLYSFLRDDSNLSISQIGLSSWGYNGYVFFGMPNYRCLQHYYYWTKTSKNQH